jgi:hypothetical protein
MRRRRKLILQSKARIDVADTAVPRDLTIAHQRRHDSRGQRLGERGELEHSVGVNGFGPANLTNAECAEKGDFIAMDEGDREPRYELSVDDLPGELLEFKQRRGDFLLGAVCARAGSGTSTAAIPARRVRLDGLRMYRPSSNLKSSPA